MIENIKTLYANIRNKGEFFKIVADDLKRSPNTVRVHYFGTYGKIPDRYQARIVELLQAQIKQQAEQAKNDVLESQNQVK